MKPRGMLMIEHRLIERMIAFIERERNRMEGGGDADPEFISAAVDFFRTYADRTHHGKEEDILFRDLEKKAMAPEDRQVMAELVAEHRQARGIVQMLAEANRRLRAGERDRGREIGEHFQALLHLYPQHIQKEDRDFFPAAESYLGTEELDRMLREFREFDQSMIHEKYRSLLDGLAE